MRRTALTALGACLIWTGCTLIVDTAPKKDEVADTATDPDVMDTVEAVDTAPEMPDVVEDFVPPCTATAVAAAGRSTLGHTCGLFQGGRAMCWGSNDGGRLGATGVDSAPTPLQVDGLESAVAAILTGGTSSCALMDGDQVRCWGTPFDATPADVTFTDTVVDLALGDGFGCAALSTGDVECFGEPSVTELAGVHTTDAASVHVCAGEGHVCALQDDQTVQCWGLNTFGQVGNGESGDPELFPRDVSSLTSVSHLACGKSHSCAALDDGTVWCWGANLAGQLGDGTTEVKLTPVQVTSLGTADVVQVAAGRAHTCARTSAGAVSCWGENDRGQLGNADPGIASAIAQDVEGLMGTATHLAAGHDHSCAVLDTGAIMCWGLNTSGELGDGTTTSWPVPVWVQAECP